MLLAMTQDCQTCTIWTFACCWSDGGLLLPCLILLLASPGSPAGPDLLQRLAFPLRRLVLFCLAHSLFALAAVRPSAYPFFLPFPIPVGLQSRSFFLPFCLLPLVHPNPSLVIPIPIPVNNINIFYFLLKLSGESLYFTIPTHPASQDPSIGGRDGPSPNIIIILILL